MGLRELRAPTSANYVHPDHLGSTNVVTDQNQDLVQTLDYYPYGATRISNSTSTNEKRKFIGQFSNETNLSYLNARPHHKANSSRKTVSRRSDCRRLLMRATAALVPPADWINGF
jgi:hypothetical protein